MTDENEHAPKFTSSIYSTIVHLEEQSSDLGFDDSENEILLKVHATDQDRGRNAKIVYSISQGKQKWNLSKANLFCIYFQVCTWHNYFPVAKEY